MISSSLRKIGRRLEQAALTLANLTIHPLSRLVPRRHDHWVFGHQFGEFAGNPKYLYLWMAHNRPDYRVTWISDRAETRRILAAQGYRAVRRWSPAGIRAALRAKVFVYAHGVDDVSLQLSGNALLLNLWHGVGLKATALGDEGGVVARHWRHRTHWLRRALYLGHVTMPTILVTTSAFMQRHFSAQFRLPVERCPMIGYPRLDTAHDPVLRAAARRFDGDGFVPDEGHFPEVYVYMPTFRDSGRDFLADALPDLGALQAVLAGRGAILYLKLHPRTAAAMPSGYANIRSWPRSVDIYAYLDAIDLLVTDYSSVLYDFLYAKSGAAILYTFDRAQYEAADRTLVYPFDENVAGLHVATFAALLDALAHGAAFARDMTGHTQRIRERFWGTSDAAACPRIVRYCEAALASSAGLPAT